MLIAVEGCAHGELDRIYETILASGAPIRLLICCGDVQTVRNGGDLACLAVPPKHLRSGDFHKYYSGEKKAPILTIFIGGNHEASNYLQELPYGGWVAPNIYYLGNAGVVSIAGIRIAGISGIFKSRDYLRGHFEYPPYSESTKRSVYHIRNLEIFRLSQLSGEVHICLSHDWPKGIEHHGDLEQLLHFKPYFRDDIHDGNFGSPPCEDLLNRLHPQYWFAGHMHCHFPAIVSHISTGTKTRFLALDKCLPRRKFLQILDIPHDAEEPFELKYDLEWLTILKLTNHLLSVRSTINYMPSEHSTERFNFTPTDDEKTKTLKDLNGKLLIPDNFEITAEPFNHHNSYRVESQPSAVLNLQTEAFCDLLQIDDPVTLLMLKNGSVLKSMSSFEKSKEEQISIDNDELDIDVTSNSFISSMGNDSSQCLSSHHPSFNDTLDKFGKSTNQCLEEDASNSISMIKSKRDTTEECESSSTCKTPRLSLPSPRFSIPNDSNDLLTLADQQNVNEQNTNESIKKDDISNERLSVIDTDITNESNTEEIVTEENDTSINNSPVAKKIFKRRNESLYSSNLESE